MIEFIYCFSLQGEKLGGTVSVCLFSRTVSHCRSFVFSDKSMIMRILPSFFYHLVSVTQNCMLLSFSYCCSYKHELNEPQSKRESDTCEIAIA